MTRFYTELSRALRSDARDILLLGLPLVGSQLAMMLLHVVDTVLMGRYSVAGLAAMVLGSSYFFTIWVLGAGFSQVVTGMVAASVGAGDETQARRETRMAMWWSLGYAVAVQPLFFHAAPVLEALGQRPELSADAAAFLRVAGLGMIPSLVAVALRGFLSALEQTRVILWTSLIAVPLNLLIAWALIFGHFGAPEMGLRGAALATVLVQSFILAAFAAAAAFGRVSAPYRLFQRFWRPDWHAFRQVGRLGFPTGLTNLAESGLFVAAALMMGWVGTIELAAHGIALQITALAFMGHVGLSQAATVRVGQADGKGDPAALRASALASVALSLLLAVCVVALFLTLPAQIVALFIDPAKPEAPQILAFGVTLLMLSALFQVFDAMQVIALGLLRGVRDTQVPMWIATFSYWVVGMPASYLFGFSAGLGAVGIWIGLVIGLAFAAVLLMARFWRGRW